VPQESVLSDLRTSGRSISNARTRDPELGSLALLPGVWNILPNPPAEPPLACRTLGAFLIHSVTTSWIPLRRSQPRNEME